MTARCPRCNSARRDGQAWPAGRRPVCPAPSLVRAARRDRSPARVQARHVPPSRSFCTRRSLPMHPPLDRRDPNPPASDNPLRVSSWRKYPQGGRRAPTRRGGGTPPPLPGAGRARPRTAAPRTCVRGVHPPTLLRQASPPFTARVSWSAGDHLCLPDDHFCLFYGHDVNESSLADRGPFTSRRCRACRGHTLARLNDHGMIPAGQGGAALRSPALDRLTHLSGRAR